MGPSLLTHGATLRPTCVFMHMQEGWHVCNLQLNCGSGCTADTLCILTFNIPRPPIPCRSILVKWLQSTSLQAGLCNPVVHRDYHPSRSVQPHYDCDERPGRCHGWAASIWEPLLNLLPATRCLLCSVCPPGTRTSECRPLYGTDDLFG